MKKIRVLYVEDETFLARIVADILESRGFEVMIENDGANALAQFKNFEPDVCLLDVMLPGKDGFAVADDIRSQSDVPLIFLSAKTAVDDVVTGFQSGGNDYLRKPFSVEELIVRIQNLLATSHKKPVDESAPVGSYQFNPHRQTLSLNNEVRKLSYRESELLKLLYTHRNEVVERPTILNLLWGSDSFFNSRTLDVYITKLRSYIRGDAALEIITIKGIGYRFVCP